MAELVYRHQDGQNLAELRNYKLVQGQLFKINGKNHYRGVAPYPVIPNIGDTWEELDAAFSLWANAWFWNGNYWLSQQVFSHFYTNPTVSNAGSIVNTYPVDANYNLFVLSTIATLFSNINATSTANWSWSLRRLSLVGATATLSTSSTQGQASNTFKTYVTPINLFVETLVNQIYGIAISESSIGGSANRLGTISYQYRLARR